jgi:hypothetical protein
MHPLAHHAGEDTLAPLLLLGGAWCSMLLTVGRARLAAARAKLKRPQEKAVITPDEERLLKDTWIGHDEVLTVDRSRPAAILEPFTGPSRRR